MDDNKKLTKHERWKALTAAHLESARARLAEKTVRDERGCLVWQGATNSRGYGCMSIGGKVAPGYPGWVELTHRVAYALEHGIDALFSQESLDHLKEKCAGNKKCCNVHHLEAVSFKENTLRGDSPTAVNARKTECLNGHPLAGDNLRITKRGARLCVACDRAQDAAARERERAKKLDSAAGAR